MTLELTALTLAALLQVVQICLYAVFGQLQVGTKTALTPRDDVIALSGKAGRMHRAMNNHFEGLILFGIACGVIAISNQSSGFTGACAVTYLCARIAYVPAYLFGWVPWRSVIWTVGILATTLMLLAALI
ncbi:MAPEG family protein [uncultured Roseovarius sp.]|uniref:MAPEG family protein n=1 Tax=uncultured Roseovarius sp. TaxID=293344 RepID=UPI002624F9EC|nr:MAPEG family protein [uncultured Roseovarius sp.]